MGQRRVVYQKVVSPVNHKKKNSYFFFRKVKSGHGIMASMSRLYAIFAAVIAAAILHAEIDFSKADALRLERERQRKGYRSQPTPGKESRENYMKEREGVVVAAIEDYGFTQSLGKDKTPRDIMLYNRSVTRYQVATNLLIQATEDPATTVKMRNFNGRRFADLAEEDEIEEMSDDDFRNAVRKLSNSHRERWDLPLSQFP